jgi:hypothetical protein
MTRSYVYGTVRDRPRGSAIFAIRIQGDLAGLSEIDQIAARMREKVEARGESAADIVVLQGDRKETLRLFGTPYAVGRVRTAMFNAAITWMPIDLD